MGKSSEENMVRGYKKEPLKMAAIIFLIHILNSNKNAANTLNLIDIDSKELEEKCKLLNRIKGYMDTDEQYIVHRAEIILDIMGKVKSLLEGPELFSAQVRYYSLSLEERKRNMLIDIGRYMEEEDRDILHMALDLDKEARKIEKAVRELIGVIQQGISLENIDRILELLDPLLGNYIGERRKEIKKISSILRLVKSLEGKDSLQEENLLELFAPYLDGDQGETLVRMMQIAKTLSQTMESKVDDAGEGPEIKEANLGGSDAGSLEPVH